MNLLLPIIRTFAPRAMLTDEDVDIFDAVARRMGVSPIRYDIDNDEANVRDACLMLLFAIEQAATNDIPRPERMHAYAFIGLDYVPPYHEELKSDAN